MLLFSALAAFGTSICWALSPMFSGAAARHFGAIKFARTRYAIVLLPMFALAFSFGDWSVWTTQAYLVLALSGFVGIALGDTLLFAGIGRLGARLGAVIFTTASPMTELLNFLFLGTAFNALKVLGIVLISVGVMVAIFYGKRQGPVHKLESLHGKLWIGVVIVLGAALFQAIGTIIAKPILDAGIDPFSGAAWRVLAAVGFYLLLWVLAPRKWVQAEDHGPYTPRMTMIAAISGTLGMLIGTTLFIWALSMGDAGIVAAIASTSPLVQLPILWVVTRQAPALGAWAGAALAVGGGALIVLS